MREPIITINPYKILRDHLDPTTFQRLIEIWDTEDGKLNLVAPVSDSEEVITEEVIIQEENIEQDKTPPLVKLKRILQTLQQSYSLSIMFQVLSSHETTNAHNEHLDQIANIENLAKDLAEIISIMNAHVKDNQKKSARIKFDQQYFDRLLRKNIYSFRKENNLLEKKSFVDNMIHKVKNFSKRFKKHPVTTSKDITKKTGFFVGETGKKEADLGEDLSNVARISFESGIPSTPHVAHVFHTVLSIFQGASNLAIFGWEFGLTAFKLKDALKKFIKGENRPKQALKITSFIASLGLITAGAGFAGVLLLKGIALAVGYGALATGAFQLLALATPIIPVIPLICSSLLLAHFSITLGRRIAALKFENNEVKVARKNLAAAETTLQDYIEVNIVSLLKEIAPDYDLGNSIEKDANILEAFDKLVKKPADSVTADQKARIQTAYIELQNHAANLQTAKEALIPHEKKAHELKHKIAFNTLEVIGAALVVTGIALGLAGYLAASIATGGALPAATIAILGSVGMGLTIGGAVLGLSVKLFEFVDNAKDHRMTNWIGNKLSQAWNAITGLFSSKKDDGYQRISTSDMPIAKGNPSLSGSSENSPSSSPQTPVVNPTVITRGLAEGKKQGPVDLNLPPDWLKPTSNQNKKTSASTPVILTPGDLTTPTPGSAKLLQKFGVHKPAAIRRDRSTLSTSPTAAFTNT